MTLRSIGVSVAFVLVLVPVAGHVPVPRLAASCESLASISLPLTRITRAQLVPAGQFSGNAAGLLGPGAPAFKPYSELPAFCRVALTLAPSNDSDIRVELWMPTETWNGKFEALGNGGWAGQISVQALAVAVRRGYAVATTDTGHTGLGDDASFAFHHPEKLIDFAYRAVHEMTVQTKTLVQTFYGRPAQEAYWNGCSTGGRQGLKEAQQYPADYDGIIAGAPASDMPHLLTSSIWIAHASLASAAGYIPPSKYAAIHRAALAACDALDGVTDGVIDDPRRCHFDPAVIQCDGDDAATCLTAAEVATARAIYAPATNPRTGVEIFPGLEPGSEMGWSGLAGPAPLGIANDYFRYVVFENPAWDFHTFDFDRDVTRAEARDHGDLSVTDPNLGAFAQRGGKLLLYHGWNDQLIAPEHTVHYYDAVVKTLGASNVGRSVRLFMMPGVTHCAGGDGPSNFDALGVMEHWVEDRQAPNQIVASHISAGAVDRTRPLCPYPEVAIYAGSGSTDDARSFVCKTR